MFMLNDIRAFIDRFGHQEVFDEDKFVNLHKRAQMMAEEVMEFYTALQAGNVPEMLDALADLMYFALGTVVLMGISNSLWHRVFKEVQRANMAKIPAPALDNSDGKGRGALNALKPVGWEPPNIKKVLTEAKYQFNFEGAQ